LVTHLANFFFEAQILMQDVENVFFGNPWAAAIVSIKKG
jgi:hypothetical protein